MFSSQVLMRRLRSRQQIETGDSATNNADANAIEGEVVSQT